MFTWCEDIGCFSLSLPRNTCLFATPKCSAMCYSNKQFVQYAKSMYPCEAKLKDFWENITGAKVRDILSRKRKQTDYVRLAGRGEAITCAEDILKLKDIGEQNPDTIFWLPSRSHIHQHLFTLAKTLLPKNIKLLLSLDPDHNPLQVANAINSGYSIMYSLNDEALPHGMFKCVKTWEHKKGENACGHCFKNKEGCFSETQTIVHLKTH